MPRPPDRPPAPPRRRVPLGRYAALILAATVVAFGPVLANGFVDFDDDRNFLQNPDLRGPTRDHLRWAMTTSLVGVYQPLGWILLEVEWSAWGLDPRGYHLASLLLHAANAVLLVGLAGALIRRAEAGPGSAPGDGGAVGLAGALAALLFAVHPLRAENVAWASAQTYLPCAGCAILATRAYLRAADSPGRGRLGWLGLAWGLYGAAMACKGAVVGLPIVFFLLHDYRHPGRRAAGAPGRWGRLRGAAELAPFVALGLAFLARGVVARRETDGLEAVAHSGIGSRAAQAAYGIAFYPWKTLAPTGLGAFYPLEGAIGLGRMPYLGAAAGVAGATTAAVLLRRRYPALLVAWLSYLALLAPSLGLVRIGRTLVADRYGYLASIPGVVLLAALLARPLAAGGWRRGATLAAVGLAGVLLAAGSRAQSATWHDSAALWTRAVAGAGGDYTLRTYLGLALARDDRLDAAIEQFEAAVALQPRAPELRINLAIALTQRRRLDAALAQLAEAVRVAPDFADARIKLASLLAARGRRDEADRHFDAAARLAAGAPELLNNLGIALGQAGRFDRAVAPLAEAARLRPADPRFRANLDHARRRAGPSRPAP